MASSEGNEWNPAIAAGPGGRFAAVRSIPLRRLRSGPFQNDLYLQRIALGPAGAMPASKPAAAVAVTGKDPRDKPEEVAAALRSYRFQSAEGPLRILRGEFHRHSEISMDGANDGAIIDQYRYMLDGSQMDWAGCCDHDNGAGREYTWWLSQKLTDIYYTPGSFATMFHYERSVQYPEGHRNIIFAQRGIRVLPRLRAPARNPWCARRIP